MTRAAELVRAGEHAAALQLCTETQQDGDTGHAVVDVLEEELGKTSPDKDRVLALLDLYVDIGRHASVGNAIPRLLGLFNAETLTSGFDIGTHLIRTIHRSIKLHGPECFFRHKGVPMSIVLPSDVIRTGSFTASMYVCCHDGYNEGVILDLDMELASLSICLENQTLYFTQDGKQHLKQDICPIRSSRWYLITLVLFGSKALTRKSSSIRVQDMFRRTSDVDRRMEVTIYLDHHTVFTGPLLEPNLFQQAQKARLHIGAFNGDVAAIHLFRSFLTSRNIASIYHSSPSFSPSFLIRGKHQVARFISADVPINGYLPNSFVRITPKSFKNGVCSPEGWIQGFNDRSKGFSPEQLQISIPSQIDIIKYPNHKKTLFTKGGITLLLTALSPQRGFLGREFTSEEEVCEVLQLMAESMYQNPGLFYQMVSLGAIALKQLLLVHIPPQMRTSNVAKSFLRILLVVEKTVQGTQRVNVDTFYNDVFRMILLDFAYWYPISEDGLCLGTISDAVVEATRRLQSILFSNQGFDASLLLHAFDSFCNAQNLFNHVAEDTVDKAVTEACQRLLEATRLAITEKQHATRSIVELLVYFLDRCTHSHLRCDLVRTLLHCGLHNFVAVSSVFVQKHDLASGDPRYLYDIIVHAMQDSTEETRICCIKLLGGLLAHVPPRKQKSLAKELSILMSIYLNGSALSYGILSAITEVISGSIRLSIDSNLATIDDFPTGEHHFMFTTFFDVLFGMSSDASTPDVVRQKLLMDFLTSIKSSPNNAMLFVREHFWQKQLVTLIFSNAQDFLTLDNQILVQILQSILWYCVMYEESGWVALDQLVWCIHSIGGETMQQYHFTMHILLHLLSQASRPLPEDAAHKKANLKMVFLLVEQLVFLSPYSFLSRHNAPSEDEMMLLERFIDAMGYYMQAFEGQFQASRILIRYMSLVFGHEGTSPLVDRTVSAVRNHLLLPRASNMQNDYMVVRLSLVLLNKARQHFEGTSDVHHEQLLRNLIHEIILFWGMEVLTQSIHEWHDGNEFRPYALSRDEVRTTSTSIGIPPLASILDTIQCIGSDDPCFEWQAETFQHFEQSISDRSRKIQQRMQAYIKRVESKTSEMEAKVIDSTTLLSSEDKAALWASLSAELRSARHAVILRDRRSLSLSLNVFQQFKQDFLAKPLSSHPFHKTLRHLFQHGDVFWKLDQTETPNRMRHVLRRNYVGHSHLTAVNRDAKTKRALREVEKELLKMASGAIKTQDESRHEDDSSNTTEDDVDETKEPSTPPSAQEPEVDGDLEEALAADDAKVLFSCDATLISPLERVKGTLSITESSIQFYGAEFEERVSLAVDAFAITPILGSLFDELNRVKSSIVRFRDVRLVLPRQYLLRKSAIEVFTRQHKSLFFNVEQHRRDELFRLLCEILRLPYELDHRRRVQYSDITSRWQKRELSNFDYLMHLNTLAGRSYSDITQYPVFPWVIQDYSSSKLDLNDPSVYRDLSKPVGALNPDRNSLFLEKYEETKGGDIPPWHYGSHYSSSGIVLYYMLRMEPFTTLAVQIQGGRFDLPDRLFHSIASCWKSSLCNVADVKELIPEFFYCPEFLRNGNSLDLGSKQDKTQLGDVVLPPWASSPEEFVELNRQALESEYVSQHLHEWIDLIFGFKQRGRDAIVAQNVFFHLTYEDSVDIDAIEDETLRLATEAQISHFGQTPSQLFRKPHPRRQPNKQIPLTFPVRFPNGYGPIFVYGYGGPVSGTSTQQLYQGVFHHVVWDDKVGITLFKHDLRTITDVIEALHTGDVDRIRTPYQQPPRHILGPGLRPGPLAFNRNAGFVFSGGYPNASIKCHFSHDGQTLSSVHGHCDTVTCISISNGYSAIVTGAQDGSVTQWLMHTKSYSPSQLPPLSNGDTYIYSEHNDAVVAVSHESNIGVIASISKDRSLATYSFHRHRFIRSIEFDSDTTLIDVILCHRPYIVLYHMLGEEPSLTLFSVNCRKISVVTLDEPIQTLYRPDQEDFFMTGGPCGSICIYETHSLRLLQVIDCFHPVPVGLATTTLQKDDFDEIVEKSESDASSMDELDIEQASSSGSELVDISKDTASVTGISIDVNGGYMVVLLSDGRVLFFPLPPISVMFDELFDNLQSSFSSEDENMFLQPVKDVIRSFSLMQSPNATPPTLYDARKRMSSVFDTLGTTFKGMFSSNKSL